MSYAFREILGEEDKPCPDCGEQMLSVVRSKAFSDNGMDAYVIRCGECESVFEGRSKLPVIGIQVFSETYQNHGNERVKLREGWLVGDITSYVHEVKDRPFVPPATFGANDAEDELRDMKVAGSFQSFSGSLDECIMRWAEGFIDLLLGEGFSALMDKGSGEWCWKGKPEPIESEIEGEEAVDTIRLTGVPSSIGHALAIRLQPKPGG